MCDVALEGAVPWHARRSSGRATRTTSCAVWPLCLEHLLVLHFYSSSEAKFREDVLR